MKLSIATSIQEAEDLLEEARKLVNAGNQPVLGFAGSHVGISISHDLAKAVFRDAERQLIKLKKGKGYVH